ncbi:MAG: hypothetical protein IJ466_10865 [Clostridia bacterium]|nr:hypothetical protein [Clostridia bacterium]
MQQTILAVSCICMAAALCEQLLDGSRYFPAVRMVLGLQIAAAAVSGILKLWKMLNG